MKKIICFIVLYFATFAAQAACVETSVVLVEKSKSELAGPISRLDNIANHFAGEVPKGAECRDLTGTVPAVHYTFQAKAGYTLYGFSESAAHVVLLDPQGAAIANAIAVESDRSHYLSRTFGIKLLSGGLHKLIVSGMGIYTQFYSIWLDAVPPAPVASCPTTTNTYNKGKLTLNSVAVPNGLGGTIKYQAILSLQPFSNPLSFVLDKAQPVQ